MSNYYDIQPGDWVEFNDMKFLGKFKVKEIFSGNEHNWWATFYDCPEVELSRLDWLTPMESLYRLWRNFIK